MLLDKFSDVEMDRYVLWTRFKINKAHVRRLINYSLSQSVAATIVTAVNGCTKIFVVDLIERALKVQMEWQAAAEILPTGEKLDDEAQLTDRTKMVDRGPLTPDHLREALRRYKKERVGDSAGVMGVSLQGYENVGARREGARNMFRKM
jgi:transcription initiation factor TFIID subunit 11